MIYISKPLIYINDILNVKNNNCYKVTIYENYISTRSIRLLGPYCYSKRVSLPPLEWVYMDFIKYYKSKGIIYYLMKDKKRMLFYEIKSNIQ